MGGPTRARKVERCDAPVVADVVWRGGCGRGGGQVEGKGGQLSAQNPSEASCAASSVGRGAAAWHDGTSRPQQSRAARGCGAEQSARGMRGARTLRVRRARAEGPRPLRVVDRAAQRTTALRRATSEADSARPRRLAGAPPDPSPPPSPPCPSRSITARFAPPTLHPPPPPPAARAHASRVPLAPSADAGAGPHRRRHRRTRARKKPSNPIRFSPRQKVPLLFRGRRDSRGFVAPRQFRRARRPGGNRERMSSRGGGARARPEKSAAAGFGRAHRRFFLFFLRRARFCGGGG